MLACFQTRPGGWNATGKAALGAMPHTTFGGRRAKHSQGQPKATALQTKRCSQTPQKHPHPQKPALGSLLFGIHGWASVKLLREQIPGIVCLSAPGDKFMPSRDESDDASRIREAACRVTNWWQWRTDGNDELIEMIHNFNQLLRKLSLHCYIR